MMKSCLPLVTFLLCCGAQFCAAEQKYSAPPASFFASNGAGRTVVLAPGDVLTIRFYYNPELNKTVKVREDGKISLDLFQSIPVAGENPDELQKKLVGLYSQEFTNPEITVDVVSQANSSVFVTGEVLLPGAKELNGKMTVATAIALSQVSQKTAGTKSVFLIRSAEDAKYRVYKLDASFPNGSARDIAMAPGDILFVPRKGIVKADDFMEQYFRQLLPATPNASASVLFSPGSSLAAAAATH